MATCSQALCDIKSGVQKVRSVVELHLATDWRFSGDQKVHLTQLHENLPNLDFSHRLTTILKLVLVKMPKTAKPPDIEWTFWNPP